MFLLLGRVELTSAGRIQLAMTRPKKQSSPGSSFKLFIPIKFHCGELDQLLVSCDVMVVEKAKEKDVRSTASK